MALTERSLDEDRKIHDYLTTETTRVYPAVAFDTMGNDLLALAQNTTGRELTPLEQDMAQTIEAIWFVGIPQIPPGRAFGLAPVYNFDQYMKQAPADHGQWKIIPVDPKPFPDQMRDGLALHQEQPFPVPLPVGMVGICSILILFSVGRKVKNRFNAKFPPKIGKNRGQGFDIMMIPVLRSLQNVPM